MGILIILICLTTLADEFNVAVDAAGIDIHIVYDHQETFEVKDDPENEWHRAKRSLDYEDMIVKREIVEDKDYEVIDLTKSGKAGLKNESWFQKIRGLALLPILGGGAILVVLFYYFVCLKKQACRCLCACCPCCGMIDPKNLARKGVDEYVPGIIINEKNEVEYYEVTESEREAVVRMGEAWIAA